VEWLESRVQPSFLTGGLDLDGGLGDDPLQDHRQDNDHLAALPSALANPVNTPSAASVAVANNGGGNSTPAAPIVGVGISQTTAELTALSNAVRTLGSGSPTATSPAGSAPANATPLATPTLTESGTLAQPINLVAVPGRVNNQGGIHPNVVTWTTFLQDQYYAQWNAVASGRGATAGSVYLAGVSTDYTNGFLAATIEKLDSNGVPDVTFGTTGVGLQYFELAAPPASLQFDTITGLAVSADGSTLYISSNIGVTTNTSGYTGVVASINAMTGAVNRAVSFIDQTTMAPQNSLFTAVTTSGSGANETVYVGGTIAAPSPRTGTDIRVASLDSSLMTVNYSYRITFSIAMVAVDTTARAVAADTAGTLYFGGTIATSSTNTGGLVSALTTSATFPFAFSWNNINDGGFGAINSLVWTTGTPNGFLYMTGTLNDSTGGFPLHTDLIIAKVRDRDGMFGMTAPNTYAFINFNGSDLMTGRTGDLGGYAIRVRNGEAFVAGIRNDLGDPNAPDTPSFVGDPFVRHFDSTGAIMASEYGLGGSNQDFGYGLDFLSSTGNALVTAGSATSQDFHSTDGTLVGGGAPPLFGNDAWASSVTV
jgi:hypothetical protein